MDSNSLVFLGMIIAILCFRVALDVNEARQLAKARAKEKADQRARDERIRKLTNRD